MKMDFYNPVRIVSGDGALANFRGFRVFGARCLIVCGGSSARRCGALADAQAALAACGVAFEVFDRVEQNPLVETCHAAGAAARAAGAEFILGIGGGSPLDAAKACAVFAANPDLGPEDVYGDIAERPALPVICVPTTAGTGSEVTAVAVLTSRARETKKSIKTPHTWPRLALLDPAYTASLPSGFAASCAADALCHAAEGYFSPLSSDVTDALAEAALRRILPAMRANADGALTDAHRADLLAASTMAGLVISRTGTAFPHACGYSVTYHCGLPHGRATALFLPAFLRMQAEAACARAERLRTACGLSAETAEELFGALLSDRPALTPEQARLFARTAAGAKNCANSIRPVTESDLLPLFSAFVKG